MDNDTKQKVDQLERKLNELEQKIQKIEKQQIVVVGDFDGTNLPVQANGIRRKIATATP
jgi:hypothetical protein